MIGIFDSGVGGLTVVKELRKILPEYDITYFGDTARTPYGNKSKDIIIKYALEDANFLIKKGAKIIVIACNTASSVAYDALKQKYPEIPIFEVITPAVEDAVKITKNRRIGVIGTKATISSGIYEKKLKSCYLGLVVLSGACPLFVPFIEEGWLKRIELKMIAKSYLASLKNHNIDTLILGCTHYPIIKDVIGKRIGRKTKLVNSASAVSMKVKNFLESSEIKFEKNGKLEIFVSDKTEQCQSIADKLLGGTVYIYESGNIE